MLTKLLSQADSRTKRLPIDRSAALVVVLLALLFALSISAAMTLHPLVDPTQAAFQGGL